MRNFCIALCIALTVWIEKAFGVEAGMPQLNPEFWSAQIFWLIIIFSTLYLIIWKVFLPKITLNIENRKSRIVSDLSEAEKLKKNAEKKLSEYNKIIEDSKKEAKKILQDNKKKLDSDIEIKRQKFNNEIEKEIIAVEKEIKNLKKNSIPNINKIASETSIEIIKKIIGTEVNNSNINAVVDDIIKKKVEKNI